MLGIFSGLFCAGVMLTGDVKNAIEDSKAIDHPYPDGTYYDHNQRLRLASNGHLVRYGEYSKLLHQGKYRIAPGSGIKDLRDCDWCMFDETKYLILKNVSEQNRAKAKIQHDACEAKRKARQEAFAERLKSQH